ncbi:MAG: omptin family outer membrane protease, partial [Psychrilyobacter sp.]|nr:omptin family outer membrane protease [Psychrilyobacter sp.]
MKLNLKVVFGILIFSTLSMAEKGQIVNEKYFNISIGTQIKNMDTRELIYKDKNSDDRLSELDWRMDGVTMIGGEIEITPTNRFSIKLGGYTSYGDNYSTMDDYDWL